MTTTFKNKTFSTTVAVTDFANMVKQGRAQPAEWIKFKPDFLANLDAKELNMVLSAVNQSAMAGFKCSNTFSDEGNSKSFWTIRKFWEFVAARGFTDHISDWMETWHKPYLLNPPVFDYAYSAAGAKPDKWDTNAVYSHVLGSSPTFFREELYNEKFFKDNNIQHIVEPMAACAELCYFGHFTHPEFTYSMLDLDASAAARTRQLPWRPGTKYEYIVGDVLKESAWSRMKLPKDSKGKSVCFIGKQSQNIFTPLQVTTLLSLAMRYCDYVILETMDYPVDYFFHADNDTTDITPAHLKFTDITVSLDILPDHAHNRVSFESNLQVALHWGRKNVRPFITYQPWHCYTPHTLIALTKACLSLRDENIWFQEDTEYRYVPLKDYQRERGKVGSLKYNNGYACGSVINLVFSNRHKSK